MDIQALRQAPSEALLLPSEVAALFRVNPKTVTRWAIMGLVPSKKTLGGHVRFRVGDIRPLLFGSDDETS